MRRKLLAGILAAAALPISATLGAGPAFAGEIKGPGSATGVLVGEPTAGPANANSICSFSGLNQFTPGEVGEFPIRTQSYGQIVRLGLKAQFPSPGVACYGHTGFFAGG